MLDLPKTCDRSVSARVVGIAKVFADMLTGARSAYERCFIRVVALAPRSRRKPPRSLLSSSWLLGACNPGREFSTPLRGKPQLASNRTGRRLLVPCRPLRGARATIRMKTSPVCRSRPSEHAGCTAQAADDPGVAGRLASLHPKKSRNSKKAVATLYSVSSD